MGASTMEKNRSFLKKLKIGLPYNPVIPLLDIYSKHTKTLIRKDTCNPYVYGSIMYNSQPKCPLTDERIKKMWCVYIDNGLILNYKEE